MEAYQNHNIILFFSFQKNSSKFTEFRSSAGLGGLSPCRHKAQPFNISGIYSIFKIICSDIKESPGESLLTRYFVIKGLRKSASTSKTFSLILVIDKARLKAVVFCPSLYTTGYNQRLDSFIKSAKLYVEIVKHYKLLLQLCINYLQHYVLFLSFFNPR